MDLHGRLAEAFFPPPLLPVQEQAS
jgi:hypothetical protein